MTATTSSHSYPRILRWFESVYTLQGKNMNNASYAWPLGSHVWQPSTKSLLSRIWAPTPRMKSWPQAIARPSCHCGLPHSPSSKPPRSRKVWFDKVVTRLLDLPGPINPTCGQSKLVHWGQNDTVLNQDRRGLPPRNLRIAMTLSPPFPSESSIFPYLSRPATTTYMNINIASTQHSYHILLVHEREILHVSGTYHLSSTDGYQVSIAHLIT
jgi:hypothetical protein